MIVSVKRAVLAVFSVIFIGALVGSTFLARPVYAAQITNRSLTLQAGASDGGSKPGGVVNHLFSFTIPSGTTLGSIQFLYCTAAAGACVTPTGLDTTSATLGSSSGVTFTSLVNTTNGAPYLSRTANTITGGTAVTYQLLTVTNPTTTNQSFYVRIATFATTNATASPTDTGTVGASTSNQITLTGIMPESLIFCTGGAVTTTSGIPDCSTATSGAINFNQLFSPTDTAMASSQMVASTNAGSGYNITVNGTTLTSGSNTVTAMSSTTTGVRGSSQFGLNLKANTTTTSTPAVGTEVAPASNGTNYRGTASTNYNTVDNFRFVTGDNVANSANSGSDGQIFTVAYAVNVPGSQPAGTYTTTLTYICTPTF